MSEPSGDDAGSGVGRAGRGVHAGRDGAGPAESGSGEAPQGASPAPGSRRERRGRAWRAAAVLGALVGLAAGAAAAWWTTRLAPVDPSTPDLFRFEVLPGWGASRVADELEAAGLIRDADAFTLLLRVRELDRSIGEGLYDLSPSFSADEVASALAAGGRPRTARLVVPEGLRASEVADRLDALGVAEAEAVLARVEAPGDLAPPWLPDGAGLEGYLFPDTYELRLDAGAVGALTRLVGAFEAVANGELGAEARAQGLTVHAWTTLASMVQAEAAGPDEMPIIAGVFRNRLDVGMLLQSDPTVAYGLGMPLPELSAVDGDLRVDHPWNTYTRPGLPAGPIGNPGRDALAAVLAPERTAPSGEPWLYFLHGTDAGEPVFRPNTSLAAHERDIDRFLR